MTIFLTPKNKKYKCNKVTMTIGYTYFVLSATYMRLHVDKWRENGASTREIVLMEFLRKFLI